MNNFEKINQNPEIFEKSEDELILEESGKLKVGQGNIGDQKEEPISQQAKEEFIPEEKEEVFDPTEKFKEIKASPKSERAEKIAGFKKEYTRQREGLLEAQTTLTAEIYKNPDVEASTLLTILQQFHNRYGFSEEQIETACSIIHMYEEKHKAISDFKKEHPDDSEMYESLVGKAPKGKIEVIQGPVSLYFKCYDKNDYIGMRMVISGEGKTPLMERLKIIFGAEHGARGGKSPIKELAGALLIENATGHTDEESEITRRHEEQHAINHLWERKSAADFYFQELVDSTKENKVDIIQHYYKEEIEEYLKDEIIAFLRSGEPYHEVKLLMRSTYMPYALNPLKRSFEDDVERLENIFRQQGMDKTIIKEKVDGYRQYFTQALNQLTCEEYKKALFHKLCDSIDLYSSMTAQKGEEGFALAINTPLRNWGTILKRLGIKKRRFF